MYSTPIQNNYISHPGKNANGCVNKCFKDPRLAIGAVIVI